MEWTFADAHEEEEDEKKDGAAAGNLGKLKQLHDKITTATKTYGKMNSGHDNVNKMKNKVQKGYRWFESGEVHPTSSPATQQLSKQVAVNMVSHSAAPSQV